MSAALEEPTAYAAEERILRQTAEFLTARRARYGCMTIQAALLGGASNSPNLMVICRNARTLRALAEFITCIFQGLTVQAINGAGRD
jgi:hypothetical protein